MTNTSLPHNSYYTTHQVKLGTKTNVKLKSKVTESRREIVDTPDISIDKAEIYTTDTTYYKTKTVFNRKHVQMYITEPRTKIALSKLTPTARSLLDVLICESANKTYIRSLNVGGTETNGKMRAATCVNLSYKWYKEYLANYNGGLELVKELPASNYTRHLKELINAEFIIKCPTDPKSIYHFNIDHFSCGYVLETLAKECEENGTKMPNIELGEEFHKNLNEAAIRELSSN